MPDRQVALLRGINVGKAKRVAMGDLRRLFEDLGYGEVRTLLNSGNVVFTVGEKSTGDVGIRIENAIASRLGIMTRVTVLPGKELAEAVRANPLAPFANNPSRLLLMPLRDPRAVSYMKALLKERWAPEALALRKRTAYLWCANGLGDSELWAAVNRVVGDGGTARNITTMTKLTALIEGT